MAELLEDGYYIYIGENCPDVPLTNGKEYFLYLYRSEGNQYVHTHGDNGYTFAYTPDCFKSKSDIRKEIIDEFLNNKK